MIKRMTWKRRFRGGIAAMIVGVMIVGQPQVVEAVRSVSEIEKDKEKVDNELQTLDAELSSIISSIATLEVEIEQKQQEIAEAEAALEEAQQAVDTQYADMKLRIQYMYENGDQSVLAILLESGSISDFLNRLEYVNSVHAYDRELLDTYEAMKREIEDMKIGLEQEKENLIAAETQLQNQQVELNSLVASKKSELGDIEKELKAAQQEARRQQQAAANSANTNGNPNASTGTTQNLNPGNVTNVSGASVVSFANQFVGCPYVWGGNSLTNGCDCSGFVHLVYANFGISVPRYSSAFASVGQEVSYNNMQPGDIIVYEPKAGVGHVAIYAGNGCIVEAQSSAAGITNNRAANCRSIWTIRRVL